MPDLSFGSRENVSLVDVLDRVLNKGAVISGEIIISLANIDLIRLDLQVVLASIESLINASGLSEIEAPVESEGRERQ